MKIPVGISARHVHLTKETFIKLFGYEELTKLKDINQPGLYASKEVVSIQANGYSFDNVRILGPFRDYNQVEISKSDAYLLKLNPSIRKSGNLDNSETITIVGPKGQKIVPVIIANRHIHISKSDANKLNVKDNQKIPVKIASEKPGIIIAVFKVSEEAFLELHLDLDDANAFMLTQGDIVEINL